MAGVQPQLLTGFSCCMLPEGHGGAVNALALGGREEEEGQQRVSLASQHFTQNLVSCCPWF